MSSKRQTIIVLLETYRDVIGVQSSATAGEREADSRALEYSNAYRQGSYAELEQLMGRMRTEAQSLHWHLSERYLRSTRKPQPVTRTGNRWTIHTNQAVIGEDTTKKRKGKYRGEVTETRIVETWNPKVRQGKVDRGLDWLTRHWRGHCRLPTDLTQAA